MKMVKMQGGVFGAVATSDAFLGGLCHEASRHRASRPSASTSASARFTALDDVSLKVAAGIVARAAGRERRRQVDAGEMPHGLLPADAGSFCVDGREVAIAQPGAMPTRSASAWSTSISRWSPSMTVAENLVMSRGRRAGGDRLGAGDARRSTAFIDAHAVPGAAGRAGVGSLAAGERQKTEILKQLYLERRLLVLDEPTSVLTPQEADEMLGLVRGLAAFRRASPSSIITHKFKEVTAFADEVTVLRRGRCAGGGPAAGLTPADMTAMMIGEPQAPAERRAHRRAEPAPRLELRRR